MTHDNHPTAAPLSRERLAHLQSRLNALTDKARPVPSDMAHPVGDDDLNTVNSFLSHMSLHDLPSVRENARNAIKAFHRIVAHLSQTKGQP